VPTIEAWAKTAAGITVSAASTARTLTRCMTHPPQSTTPPS
jgi:hypothetical protein